MISAANVHFLDITEINLVSKYHQLFHLISFVQTFISVTWDLTNWQKIIIFFPPKIYMCEIVLLFLLFLCPYIYFIKSIIMHLQWVTILTVLCWGHGPEWIASILLIQFGPILCNTEKDTRIPDVCSLLCCIWAPRFNNICKCVFTVCFSSTQLRKN